MTLDQLWRIYCERNPRFAKPDARITITGRGIRKMVETTWERGFIEGGKASGKADDFNGLSELFRAFGK